MTFWLRRAHSLCGLVCLGLFLLEHIFTNAQVLIGPDFFDRSVAMLAAIPTPVMVVLNIVIAVPFLFHGIYGVCIGLQAKNNPHHYTNLPNVLFTLQRLTAWYLLAFLVWHVGYLVVAQRWLGGVEFSFAWLQAYFANPLYWLLYLLGMWAAIFHFCNGITTFCLTWGIITGKRAQCVLTLLTMGLCGALCALTLAFMLRYLM